MSNKSVSPKTKNIKYEELKRLFRYEDGNLYSTKPCGVKAKAGNVTFHLIYMNGVRFRRSALVWFYHHGQLPPRALYHKDNNTLNDRIENLTLNPKERLKRIYTQLIKHPISQADLKTIFDYRNGKLYWGSKKYGNRIKLDKPAGSDNKKLARIIIIGSRSYRRARLVWLWHKGYLTNKNIYHINGDQFDDRIQNLTTDARFRPNLMHAKTPTASK